LKREVKNKGSVIISTGNQSSSSNVTMDDVVSIIQSMKNR